MKKIFMAVFLLSPFAASAQQGMDPETMQKLQEMAACMAQIDQNEMKAMEKETEAFEAEAKGLCKSGKRDEAQKLAMEFGKKIVNSPVLVTMRECTEGLADSLKGMMPDMSAEKMTKDFSNKHVCDDM
jgi:hypothetical protein